MPGWGDWAGAGIDPSKQKQKKSRSNKKLRRKLVIRPQDVLTKEEKEQMIRQDKNLEHVIISEKKDAKIAAYQVNKQLKSFS